MKRKMICLVLVMAMMVGMGGCTASQQAKKTTTGDARAESLTIAISKDENSLTPFTYVSSTGLIVNRLIYDTLFTTDAENEVVPWMVESDYKIENDFTIYTLTLLDGQKFHDGTPVTAEDIKFSFTYPGTQKVSSQKKICNSIKSIDVIDEKTVVINLKATDINFIRSGLAAMRIISKKQYENQTDAATINETVGSGMYKLSEYKVGEYYKLEAVSDYFKGEPKVKNIKMPIIKDNTVVQQGLLSGELAAATSSISVEMLDTFKSDNNLAVFANPGYSPMILNINNGRAPMDNKEFRTALTYAIDVNGIMDTLYSDYATVGTQGIIRSDMSYAQTDLKYTYDADKANKLLDKAGFEKKNDKGIRLTADGKPCSFEILVYSSNTDRIRAAELITQQLKTVGIELTVKAMEMDTVDAFVWPDFDVSKGRDYDFAMWGWGTSINPDFLPGMFSSNYDIGTSNVCGYANAEFDKLVETDYQDVKTTNDLDAVLKDMQTVINEDPGLINFGYADSLQVCSTAQYKGWVEGKGLNVINIYSFLGEK